MLSSYASNQYIFVCFLNQLNLVSASFFIVYDIEIERSNSDEKYLSRLFPFYCIIAKNIHTNNTKNQLILKKINTQAKVN